MFKKLPFIWQKAFANSAEKGEKGKDYENCYQALAGTDGCVFLPASRRPQRGSKGTDRVMQISRLGRKGPGGLFDVAGQAGKILRLPGKINKTGDKIGGMISNKRG